MYFYKEQARTVTTQQRMQLQCTWKACRNERLCLNLFFNEFSLHMKIGEGTNDTKSHKECLKTHCNKEKYEQLSHVMLRCNKAKDDLACDPKAIVVFKKKGLQDPRDCELPETCQSTEMFLLLPNSTRRCACIPAGWAPC